MQFAHIRAEIIEVVDRTLHLRLGNERSLAPIADDQPLIHEHLHRLSYRRTTNAEQLA